ncbi:group III truncated hemoglobin [Hymenobacter glaciei]|uniref:Group III truncated hemoglobin n=1 Tax=Hymenobacter glaciei TaxID=877209 RepID=A0ABP7UWT5_9BACT
MPNSRPDITTEADVQLLVDTFYTKVNHDALLDPVFNGFAHVDWPRHLPVMYDFWSSLLLGTTRYHGRPFPKHLPLPIAAAHFQRWLALFEATVNELFNGPKSEEAKVRAQSIATLFEHRLRERNPLALQ